MSVCCTPTSAESGPGGRSPAFLEEAPQDPFLGSTPHRPRAAAGRGRLRFLPMRFPSRRDSFPLFFSRKKPDEKNSSQSSPCSPASATFSPSLEGVFLRGSHPGQAAPGLGRTPLQEGDRVTPRICGRGGRAGLALHPAASPVGAPAGTGRAGRPVASRDPTATVVKAIFFLSLLKRAILKKALERGSMLLLNPFCAQDLEIRTPQPILRAGYHTRSGAAPIPPAQTRSLPARRKPTKRW